jgi:P2-related tail formation protein
MCATGRLTGIVVIAAKQITVGFGDALGRIEQAFTVGIITRPGDESFHRSLDLVARGAHEGGFSRGVRLVSTAINHSVHGTVSPVSAVGTLQAAVRLPIRGNLAGFPGVGHPV